MTQTKKGLTPEQLIRIEAVPAWSDDTPGNVHILGIDHEDNEATLYEGGIDGYDVRAELDKLYIDDGKLVFEFIDDTRNETGTWKLTPLVESRL